MMKFVLSALLVIMMAAQPAFCETFAYASLSKSQVCDVYIPDELIQPVIKKALAKGYAADVKACVRWVKANAEKFSLDADDLTIWGGSAGAYLSVMTKLTPEISALNGDVSDNGDYSSYVKNLVSFYAPVEFYTMDDEFNALGLTDCANHNDAASFESKYLGQALNQDKSTTDRNVPYTQSANLAERLNAENVKFSLIDGAGHMDAAFYTDENLDAIFAYLSE